MLRPAEYFANGVKAGKEGTEQWLVARGPRLGRGPTSLLGLLEGPEHRVCLGRLVKAGRPFLVLALVDANDQHVSVHLVDRLVDRVFAPLADALEVQELRVRGRVEGDDLPLLLRPEGPLGALDGEAETLIVPGLLLPVLGFDPLDDPLTLQRLEFLPRRLVERVGPDGECQHAAG